MSLRGWIEFWHPEFNTQKKWTAPSRRSVHRAYKSHVQVETALLIAFGGPAAAINESIQRRRLAQAASADHQRVVDVLAQAGTGG